MGAAQVTAFTAACPCGDDALWRVSADSHGDLSRTVFAYEIDCRSCATPDPVPLAAALDLSRAAWIRRSA